MLSFAKGDPIKNAYEDLKHCMVSSALVTVFRSLPANLPLGLLAEVVFV